MIIGNGQRKDKLESRVKSKTLDNIFYTCYQGFKII